MWRMGQVVTQFSMQANVWLPWMCIFIPHTTYRIYYNWHLYKGVVWGVGNLHFYRKMMGSGLSLVWGEVMSIFEWIRMMIWYIWHWCLTLVAWRHQAITWTNVDLLSLRSSGIHLSPISQEIPQPSIAEKSLKITYHLKFHSNLPGDNALVSWVQ